jgi:hypothetical protein
MDRFLFSIGKNENLSDNYDFDSSLATSSVATGIGTGGSRDSEALNRGEDRVVFDLRIECLLLGDFASDPPREPCESRRESVSLGTSGSELSELKTRRDDRLV